MSALTASRLRELLHYETDTGVFTRLVKSGTAKVGDVAGGLDDKGYWRIRVDGKRYLAHRLAWLYMTGEWPTGEVDHERGETGDNRWKRLRDGSRSFNQQNQRRAPAGSATGQIGASPHRGKFQAQIRVDQKNRYLGVFDTPEAAHAAYVAAKRQLHAGCTL